jgi:hypothetical protein
MPIDAKLYRVLIASPRDTEKERNIIREEISRWNSMHAESLAIVFLPTGWETGAPDLKEPGQAVINRQFVDNCDLLIGTFRTLIGTKTAEFESGTVEEIERARAEGKRCIVYFYENPSVVIADKEQYERLLQYKEELKKRGLISLYKNLPDFRKKVLAHITNAIQELARDDRERKASENEARITEQAIGLPTQENLKFQSSNVDFTTLANSQITIKYLLESRFGIQDMEDARDEEIVTIKKVLSSPELAAHFGGHVNSENISSIVQIIETVSIPSLFAISSICKYGDENLAEWSDLVAEWIERLSKPKIEGTSNWAWTIRIKNYPSLLALYTLGISALRSRKVLCLKEIMELQIYSNEYGRSVNLLHILNPFNVFYDNVDKLIEPGFTTKDTPVSDHLSTFIKDTLYPNEEMDKYLEWFDLFEFLFCLKSLQIDESRYFGAFKYRTDTREFISNAIQEAVLTKSRLG